MESNDNGLAASDDYVFNVGSNLVSCLNWFWTFSYFNLLIINTIWYLKFKCIASIFNNFQIIMYCEQL